MREGSHAERYKDHLLGFRMSPMRISMQTAYMFSLGEKIQRQLGVRVYASTLKADTPDNANYILTCCRIMNG